jgi:hypothetical protein
MVCEHLHPLEAELKRIGIPETFRGQAWSSNCHEWAYFDCHLDLASLRKRLGLANCVIDHENTDTHSGTERGFVCQEHHDGVIGTLTPAAGKPVIRCCSVG